MNPSLPNPINVSTTFEDDETYLLARDTERAMGTINAQIPGAAAANGYGVRRGVGNEMEVTAGTGRSVNIATGMAVVGGVGEGMGCIIQLADPIAKNNLAANRDAENPLYLFVRFDEGDLALQPNGSITHPDSFETRQGFYDTADTETLAGAVLLARITTSANAVLSVVDKRQFIEIGSGTSLPDGGTPGQILTVIDEDGAAGWVNAPTGNAPAQNQQFRLTYQGSSNSPIVLNCNGQSANITPGSLTATQKTNTATMLGGTASDVTITGDNVAAVSSYPTSFTVTGGSHPGNYTLQSGTTNGVARYNTAAGVDYFSWDGTKWIIGHVGYGDDNDVIGGTNPNDPTAGWSGGVTFSNVVAGTTTPANINLLFDLGGSLAGQQFEITTSTPGATLQMLRLGSAAGTGASQETADRLLARIEGLAKGTIKPRAVSQSGHGFVVGDRVRCTGANTYAKVNANTEAGARLVGFVASVESANAFTYTPIGPIIAENYPLFAGEDYYVKSDEISNGKPTTPGAFYLPYLRAINASEGVLLSGPVQQVPPKPIVTGSRGGNAALTSLLAGLATANLITDSTTT